MLKGWYKNSKGDRRYFDKKTGEMRTGLRPINSEYYYFDAKTGWAQKGFQTVNGYTRYFQPATFTMSTGWMKIQKSEMVF